MFVESCQGAALWPGLLQFCVSPRGSGLAADSSCAVQLSGSGLRIDASQAGSPHHSTALHSPTAAFPNLSHFMVGLLISEPAWVGKHGDSEMDFTLHRAMRTRPYSTSCKLISKEKSWQSEESLSVSWDESLFDQHFLLVRVGNNTFRWTSDGRKH